MMATLVALAQDDQPERDLLKEYAEALESEEGNEVTRFLQENGENEAFMQTAGLLHQMFDPDQSFIDQLAAVRKRQG